MRAGQVRSGQFLFLLEYTDMKMTHTVRIIDMMSDLLTNTRRCGRWVERCRRRSLYQLGQSMVIQ